MRSHRVSTGDRMRPACQRFVFSSRFGEVRASGDFKPRAADSQHDLGGEGAYFKGTFQAAFSLVKSGFSGRQVGSVPLSPSRARQLADDEVAPSESGLTGAR